MTDLSTACAAVLDAATERWLDVDDDIPAQVAAAALRAAADGWRAEVGGITQTDYIRGVLRSAEALDEIADELEGTDG